MTRLPQISAKLSLLWQVFSINAVLLVVATLTLAASPATVSNELIIQEVVVLIAGVVFVLVANLLLLRRTLNPLAALTRLMGTIDLLRPGQRLAASGGGREVCELAAAFNDMLSRLELERRESGRRAIEAQEQERRRLALELHDEVGQTLTGVVLALDGLRRDVPAALTPSVEHVQDIVRDGAEHVRDIARGLRPESLEEFGLRTTLIGLLNGIAEQGGVRVERRIDPSLPALHRDAELVLFRVAQESLTNVLRHASATCVSVEIGRCAEDLELRITDDGVGIDADRLASPRGIRGMRERALYVGGTLQVKTVHPRGTEVYLRLPCRGVVR